MKFATITVLPCHYHAPSSRAVSRGKIRPLTAVITSVTPDAFWVVYRNKLQPIYFEDCEYCEISIDGYDVPVDCYPSINYFCWCYGLSNTTRLWDSEWGYSPLLEILRGNPNYVI